MNEEQLELFETELPLLNDTEEALLHYMKRCMDLETELKEVKEKIAELKQTDPDDWDNNWTDESIISRG
jgi:hypothetical protein